MNAKAPVTTLPIWIWALAISLVALLSCCLFVAEAAQHESLAPKDGARVAEFRKRVQEYVALHRRLEGPLPTLEVSEDPKEIQTSIEALAVRLRAARVKVKEGDIFTNEMEIGRAHV